MTEFERYIGYLLIQVMKAHRSVAEGLVSPHGLYLGQEMVLFRLWEEDGLTLSQLTEQLGVEPPTVTKMVQRMEKAGLLQKRQDEHDARVSRVFLTEQSRALQAPISKAWQMLEAQTLQGFSEADLIVMRRMLQQMLENLSKTE